MAPEGEKYGNKLDISEQGIKAECRTLLISSLLRNTIFKILSQSILIKRGHLLEQKNV